MTGGRVVVLGATGKNFAAGMSGGIAYVLDEKSNLYRNLNKEMISIELVESKYDIAELKNMMMLSAQMEDKGLSSEQAQIEAFYESMRK